MHEKQTSDIFEVTQDYLVTNLYAGYKNDPCKLIRLFFAKKFIFCIWLCLIELARSS